jgi:hypothetical protein
VKLAKSVFIDGIVNYIPDSFEEGAMIERALKDSLVIEVYQGNTLIGHVGKHGIVPVPQAEISYAIDAPRVYAFIPALTNEYVQIMPGTYSQQRATILEENEFYLLVDLLNMRIIEASKQGIPDNDESQVFRRQLCKKLVPLLRKPLVMVSEPLPSLVEAYNKGKRQG